MTILIAIVALVLLGLFFVSTYKVVDPNQAHVIVFMGRGRKIYSPKLKDGGKGNTSYFYIPLLMKRFILPLTNVKMDINNIHLNDMEVAPFICDVITWIRIDDPIVAAERLNLSNENVFSSLKEDLINIVQATARTSSMKQEILDILKDRSTFSKSVFAEVDPLLKEWGVKLVNLEVNDIKDDVEKDSQIISDYESIRKINVNTKARKEIALKDREAVEIEQENKKMAEIATAQAEEESAKKVIEKDKNIGIAKKQQEQEIAKADEVANEQKVKAQRTLQVGQAKVVKEAKIEEANGIGEAIRIEGEKQAEVTKLTGNAEANVVEAKGLAEGKATEAKGIAEALAKDKMAEAMAKYNEAGTEIEKIRAKIEIAKAMWSAHAQVAKNANIKVVQSGKGQSILGFPLNAETGADMGQMLDGLGDEGLKGIINKLISGKEEEIKE